MTAAAQVPVPALVAPAHPRGGTRGECVMGADPAPRTTAAPAAASVADLYAARG